jgi:hypothetical protein
MMLGSGVLRVIRITVVWVVDGLVCGLGWLGLSGFICLAGWVTRWDIYISPGLGHVVGVGLSCSACIQPRGIFVAVFVVEVHGHYTRCYCERRWVKRREDELKEDGKMSLKWR